MVSGLTLLQQNACADSSTLLQGNLMIDSNQETWLRMLSQLSLGEKSESHRGVEQRIPLAVEHRQGVNLDGHLLQHAQASRFKKTIDMSAESVAACSNTVLEQQLYPVKGKAWRPYQTLLICRSSAWTVWLLSP